MSSALQHTQAMSYITVDETIHAHLRTDPVSRPQLHTWPMTHLCCICLVNANGDTLSKTTKNPTNNMKTVVAAAVTAAAVTVFGFLTEYPTKKRMLALPIVAT